MATTTRPPTKTITMPSASEEPIPEPVTQRKRADGGRFRLQVDRQTKASYATYEAAEKAGTGNQERASDPSSRGLRRRREREQDYRIAVIMIATRDVLASSRPGLERIGAELRRLFSQSCAGKRVEDA